MTLTDKSGDEVLLSSTGTKFENIGAIMNASVEDLCRVDDIGNESAQSVVNFFNGAHVKALIERLIDAGVSVESKEKPLGNALEGKTVVVTGTLPTLKRSEAEALIRAHGGNASGSVSKKTDFVLCGAEAGSKLTKAQSLGIKIINEDEFLEIINSRKGD